LTSNGTGNVMTSFNFADTTGAMTTSYANIGDLTITGYTTTAATATLAATDTLNVALAKLEKNINQEIADRQQAVTNC